MIKTTSMAGASLSRIAAVAAILLVCPFGAGCSTSALEGPPSAGRPEFVEGLQAPDRIAAITNTTAVEQPDVDPIETGAIGTAGAFNSVAIPIHNFPVAARWDATMREIRECAGRVRCGGYDLLDRIAAESEGKTLVEKVGIVNAMVNNTIRYRSDLSLYGKLDHWASPQEILSRASGDCEDFAILKMTALMRAGLPAESLSLVVVRDSNRGLFHAVLAVATRSGSFVLDNTRPKVARDTDLPAYRPLYSLSQTLAWIHGTRTKSDSATARNDDFASAAPGEDFRTGQTVSSLVADLDDSLRLGLPALE